MKVLRLPEPDKPITRTCAFCEALLEIDMSDIHHKEVDNIPKEAYVIWSFTCGNCRRLNALPDHAVPRGEKTRRGILL